MFFDGYWWLFFLIRIVVIFGLLMFVGFLFYFGVLIRFMIILLVVVIVLFNCFFLFGDLDFGIFNCNLIRVRFGKVRFGWCCDGSMLL